MVVLGPDGDPGVPRRGPVLRVIEERTAARTEKT
jgi:hypothetical protein